MYIILHSNNNFYNNYNYNNFEFGSVYFKLKNNHNLTNFDIFKNSDEIKIETADFPSKFKQNLKYINFSCIMLYYFF